ncbi:MAG: 2Fe-2S iron-sulfur cluster binding domain-containing protein, partial [Sedimentisphaerales bacterium]|nr:2Fe-2S iron-sulfur cluster binding domain-containing protein [Sedimentisphaerales bacterium]
MDQYRIKFLPDGVTVTIPAGQNLLQAAKAAGIDINSSCGGKGNCD